MDDSEAPLTVRRSLSPSRAGDFQNCPLLYRFRTIDRLPEPADPVMVRGTLVHAVLEDLFAEPAPGRTLDRAVELLPGEWDKLRADEPRLAELFTAEQAADETTWLASCVDLLRTYFEMEDPRWLEPAVPRGAGGLRAGVRRRRSPASSTASTSHPTAASGWSTTRRAGAPNPRFEDKAMFQMRFYALVIWRTRGVIPTLLQLMYFGDGSFLRYEPIEQELLATERKLVALWAAIERAIELRDFPPRKSGLCGWCAHQALCPEFGGTPPEMPTFALVNVTTPAPA